MSGINSALLAQWFKIPDNPNFSSIFRVSLSYQMATKSVKTVYGMYEKFHLQNYAR
jgi:hypothetical protein